MRSQPRVSFVPQGPIGGSHLLPLSRTPSFNLLSHSEKLKAAILALSSSPIVVQAIDQLAARSKSGGGDRDATSVSKELVSISLSRLDDPTPQALGDVMDVLEQAEHVRIPWLTGGTVIFELHKGSDWIHITLWGQPHQ